MPGGTCAAVLHCYVRSTAKYPCMSYNHAVPSAEPHPGLPATVCGCHNTCYPTDTATVTITQHPDAA
jgi:hypothetical protein